MITAPRRRGDRRRPYAGAVPVRVRPARAADLAAIARVYGYAVRDSVATFDVADPPPSYWQDKLASTAPGDHVLVVEAEAEAEAEGTVAGFAYSTAFRPRPAYAHTRETSIYLAPDAVGRGRGTVLYTELLDRLRRDGMHVAVAVVAQPNPASVALHERLGFELVGTLREVGRKFDRWIDTRWYQRRL
jgi:L-amino acid N-acyltransferase YncA